MRSSVKAGVVLAAGLFVALFAGYGRAEDNIDLSKCRNTNQSAEQMIRLCTGVILSEKASVIDKATAYRWRGSAYGNLNSDREISDYKKSVELNPHDSQVYFAMGAFYANKDDYARAIDYLNKAIEIDPNDDWYYGTLGLVYKNMMRRDSAITEFEKAIKLNPNNPEWYHKLGDIYSEIGNNILAQTYYDKFVKLQSEKN